MNKDSDIKFNNGFRLVPLSTIEEKFSTPSNNKKNKNKDNSPKNHFLKWHLTKLSFKRLLMA